MSTSDNTQMYNEEDLMILKIQERFIQSNEIRKHVCYVINMV